MTIPDFNDLRKHEMAHMPDHWGMIGEKFNSENPDRFYFPDASRFLRWPAPIPDWEASVIA